MPKPKNYPCVPGFIVARKPGKKKNHVLYVSDGRLRAKRRDRLRTYLKGTEEVAWIPFVIKLERAKDLLKAFKNLQETLWSPPGNGFELVLAATAECVINGLQRKRIPKAKKK